MVIMYRVYIHYQQKQTNQQQKNTQDPNGNSPNKGGGGGEINI